MVRQASIFDKMHFPDYVFVEYPKVLYGAGGATITVENEEAEKKLEGDWFTTPDEAKKL